MPSVGDAVGVSVKTQVSLADGLAGEDEEDEEEDGGGEEQEGAMEIPSVEAEEDAPPEEEEKQGSVKDGDFVAAADFVDEVCFFAAASAVGPPYHIPMFRLLRPYHLQIIT